MGPAKPFRVVPLDDPAKTVSLDDLKGKVVLIDYWATWCGPCKMAMPEVERVWKEYGDKGLAVVSVSGEDRPTVAEFHRTSPFTYPVYLDPNARLSTDYVIQQIPTFLLIKDGAIVWRQAGYTEGMIEKAVAQALS